ncbi:MAG TPA: hypothetical protein VIJ65_06040 [Acidobacteriaceae bacterium]
MDPALFFAGLAPYGKRLFVSSLASAKVVHFPLRRLNFFAAPAEFSDSAGFA